MFKLVSTFKTHKLSLGIILSNFIVSNKLECAKRYSEITEFVLVSIFDVTLKVELLATTVVNALEAFEIFNLWLRIFNAIDNAGKILKLKIRYNVIKCKKTQKSCEKKEKVSN